MSPAIELQSILTVRHHHVELCLALTGVITVNQMSASCFIFAKRVASYHEPSRRKCLCAQRHLLNFEIQQPSTVQSEGFLQEKIEAFVRKEEKIHREIKRSPHLHLFASERIELVFIQSAKTLYVNILTDRKPRFQASVVELSEESASAFGTLLQFNLHLVLDSQRHLWKTHANFQIVIDMKFSQSNYYGLHLLYVQLTAFTD